MLVHILTGLQGTRIGLDVIIAFYCFILRHDWVSLLFCAWDQQLCVQAVFGGVLDQLEVQMATDLFWKYMELSTQNAVRREDPLTWLWQFFESFRWPQFAHVCMGSSLFHAFQIFSETSHIIVYHIWICLKHLKHLLGTSMNLSLIQGNGASFWSRFALFQHVSTCSTLG